MKYEMPSLSKELDKHLALEVVPGEVTSNKGHYYFAFALTPNEHAATIPEDLWAFYIRPGLKSLAERLNREHTRVKVRTLALPPSESVAAAYISADGKLPLRFTIVGRAPTETNPDAMVLYIIDTLIEDAE